MRLVVCIKQMPMMSAMQFEAALRTIWRQGVSMAIHAFDVPMRSVGDERPRRVGGGSVQRVSALRP